MKTSFFALLAMLCMMSCTPTFNGTLYRIQENGLYGFIDSVGNVIIEPQYKYVSPFSDGLALVVHDIDKVHEEYTDFVNVKYYYINKKNKLVMDTVEVTRIASNAFLGQDGYAGYDLDSWCGKFNGDSLGFCDRIFDGLSSNDGRILFQDENTKRWGYKDVHGQIKILPIYPQAGQFHEGRAAALDTTLVMYIIDIDGNRIFNHSFFKGVMLFPYFYNNGFILGYDTKNYHVINKKGLVVASLLAGAKYYPFSDNGYSLMELSTLGFSFYSYVNTNGDLLTDLNGDGELALVGEVFSDATEYSEGYASALDADGWVFIDEHFQPVSEVYDSTGCFSEGYSKVKKNWRWGYVDKDFNQVISFRYEECGNFHHGLAYFYNSGVEGYINKSGEVVWSTIRKRK